MTSFIDRLHDDLVRAAAPAAPALERTPAPRRTAPRASRRQLRGLALGGALAAGGVAAGVLTLSSSPAGPPPAAAAVLHALARVAAVQPAVTAPGPGQYQYTQSEATDTGTYAQAAPSGGAATFCTVQVRDNRQTWIGPDGSGMIVESQSPTGVSTPAGCAAQLPAPPSSTSSRTWYATGCLSITPTNLSALPIDPTALRAELQSRQIEGGPPGPAEDFAQIGDLLRETDASPALRSALYTIAAGLPGVRSLGTITDQAGRNGVGLAIDSGGAEHVMIFDPQTSALLATQTSAADSPTSYTVYLRSQVVGSLPAPAPAALTPACTNGTSRTIQTPAGTLAVGTGS
ncbi:MAG TPA: CU044_5270 family protein [Solirubrobacteraceae bacterium]|jgi:hypothetical protein|nr:CU044_5270 family protein [Solirubrobacteraceae bacterium]